MDKLIQPIPLAAETGDLALLLRVTSAANRSASIDEIAAKSLAVIERRIPFDIAFFLLVGHSRSSITVAHPVHLPPELVAALQNVSLPPDFFSSVQAERYGVYALSQLGDAIRTLLSPLGFAPIILPLQAEEHAIGILTLAKHGNGGDELSRLFLANKDLIDGIGAQLGLAFQRAQLVEQLRTSEKKFRGMIEHNPDGVWEMDMTGKTTLINQGALEIVEYTEEETQSWHYFEPAIEGLSNAQARWERLVEDGFVQDERIPIRTGKGANKIINATVWLVHDAAGNPTNVQMVFRDVTARVRSEEELRQRNQEMDVLNQIGVQLSHPLDLEASMDAVCGLIVSLTQMDAAVIFVLDDETGRIRISAARNLPSDLVAQFARMVGATNMSARNHTGPMNMFEAVIREKRTLVLSDITTDQQWSSPMMISAGLRAGIATPLRFGEQVYGILAVGSHTARSFTDNDPKLIENIALRLALRIRNKQLFDRMQRQLSELRALAQVGEWLAAGGNSRETLTRVVEQIAQVLHSDGACLHLQQEERLQLAACSGAAAPELLELATDEWQRWAQGPVLALSDLSLTEVEAPEREQLRAAGIAACMAAPLTSSKGNLGFLLIRQSRPRTWTGDEQQLLATFARQIATNLHNVTLLWEARARVTELEALSEIATLTGALLDEDSLIELALTSMQELLGMPVVAVHLLSGYRFLQARVHGGEPDQAGPMMLNPAIRQAFERRQPIVIDRRHGWNFSADGEARLHNAALRAVISVPLMTATEPLGLLSVSRRDDHVWSQSEIRSVQTIANQLATAIMNARLFQEQIERARRLTLLAELSQACSATLDLDELLRVAAEKTQRTLGASLVSIRLVQDGVLAKGIGIGYLQPELRPKFLPIEGPLYNLLTKHEPLIIRDIDLQKGFPTFLAERMRTEQVKALLDVPLVARGESLGFLRTCMRETHVWTQAEIQFAQTVANTVAVSISNARLFESLQQERRDLGATLDSVFSGVFTTDQAGHIQTWNRAAAQMTGYDAAQVLGRNWTELAHIDKDKPDELIYEAMAEAETVFGIVPRTLVTADGREIPLAEAAAPLRDPDGQLRGAVGAFWDRTKEHAAERARLDFVHEVSHELRNSLTAILPMAEMLRDPDVKGTTRERATGVITDQVERLRAFSKRFLEFEQDQFATSVEEQTLDLGSLIQEMVTLIGSKYPMLHIAFRCKTRGVYADKARLETVLLNLLDNACKYSPRNGKVMIESKRTKGDEVRIAIRNQGPPIPADDMAHLFERGYRGQQSASGQVDGTGIGLWLVRAKLREMGGEIHVMNGTRAGVCFIFTLCTARKNDEKPIKNPGRRRRPVRGRRSRRST